MQKELTSAQSLLTDSTLVETHPSILYRLATQPKPTDIGHSNGGKNMAM